jgi:hypothetical protein
MYACIKLDVDIEIVFVGSLIERPRLFDDSLYFFCCKRDRLINSSLSRECPFLDNCSSTIIHRSNLQISE